MVGEPIKDIQPIPLGALKCSYNLEGSDEESKIQNWLKFRI